ncbi:MAG: orotidine 5'-phosphate decarboxylase [Planctomycetota bacterium]|jgi:3-hexulose-6-phosphate synthase|nr:orotidine 5'-phosphate decarboxylase [Planctomycetota bacterium]
MELQLALDVITDKRGMEVAAAVGDLIDVLELGTPFVFTYPLSAIGEFKRALPGVRILADYKIMDGGAVISKIAFDAGADIATVSARTWDGTIEEAIGEARSRSAQVLVDMMGVPDDEMARRGREIEALGADYICVHRAVSVKGAASPEGPLRILRDAVGRVKIAVAGGITLEALAKIVPHRPDLVIVGSAIANSADPRAVALAMRGVMEGAQ